MNIIKIGRAAGMENTAFADFPCREDANRG